MPTPIAGLKLMPTGTTKNEAIFNEDLILFEALLYRGVVSQAETDPSSLSPTDGQAWLVPTGSPNVLGDWIGHDSEVAVYYGSGWRFIPAGEGLTLWIVDEAKSVQYRSGAWGDSGTDGGGSAAPAVLGTIDFSVNNVTTSEASALQITGMEGYKNILLTIKGCDPAETSSVRMRLLTVGGSVGATGIYDGMTAHVNFAGGYVGYESTTHITLTGLSSTQEVDNVHGTISGHWNSVTPTRVEGKAYDNDGTGSDNIWSWDFITSTTTIYGGISLFTTVGTVSVGVATLYGWD